MKDKKIRTAWRILMEVMKQSGDFDLYSEEETIIVNAMWELESLREKRDKAIEYINNFKVTHNIDGDVAYLDEFHILASPKKLLEILKVEE